MQQEITRELVQSWLPRRQADSNKGSYGSVLAAAGSLAYRGAAALCAEGALRGGAGLVYLASVEPVVQMVLAGKLNKNIVSRLGKLGGKAIGLCGLDGALFQAKKLDEKYGLVGKIVKVAPQVVNDALTCGYIPVVSTVALGIDNDTAYNINADTAAAELAISLGAEKLILLTDVRGVLRDPKDNDTLIRQIRLEEVPSLLSSGVIGGGMIPKIQCCVNALEHGVHRTHILDGRIPHSILTEMLSHQGIGTMIWE